LERALTLNPGNEEYLHQMGALWHEMGRQDIELKALSGLDTAGLLPFDMTPALCQFLRMDKRYKQALDLINKTLSLMPEMKVRNKKAMKAFLILEQLYCQIQLDAVKNQNQSVSKSVLFQPIQEREKTPEKCIVLGMQANTDHHPDIDISVEVDAPAFEAAFIKGGFIDQDRYELALERQGLSE
jgi:hypothetical protein